MATWKDGAHLLVLAQSFALAGVARADTIVLDPGPGTDYLIYSCGGQQINEVATDFDASGNATTLVTVTTTCPGSGHNSPSHHHLSCWTVSFDGTGGIQLQTEIATNEWLQGDPSEPCPVIADPDAVFQYWDVPYPRWCSAHPHAPPCHPGAPALTLSTSLIGSGYRAVLERT
jgi:hypothetical protein